MSRRLPGATESERLTMATVKDEDQLTTRHNPGTLDDVDLGLSKAILQSEPVCVCTSAAQTIAKTASLSSESFPDFKLINGRKVIVYMANANTASSPTLNVANTGAIPLEGDYWEAGTFLYLQYVDITVSGSRIQRWLVDQGAKNTKSQLNGALTNWVLGGNGNGGGTFAGLKLKTYMAQAYKSQYGNAQAYTFNLPFTFRYVIDIKISAVDSGGNVIQDGYVDDGHNLHCAYLVGTHTIQVNWSGWSGSSNLTGITLFLTYVAN